MTELEEDPVAIHGMKLGTTEDIKVVLDSSINRLNQLPELGEQRRARLESMFAKIRRELEEYHTYRSALQKQ